MTVVKYLLNCRPRSTKICIRMRPPKKNDTMRALMILVMLMGTFQLIYIYANSPNSTEDILEQPISEFNYRTQLVVRHIAFPTQELLSSPKHVLTTGVKDKNQTLHDVPMPATMYINNARDSLSPPCNSVLIIPPVCGPLLYGYRRNNKGFLTIGIPSIRRPNTESVYLYQTLESLINNTNEKEKREITVVVLLSDLNETFNDKIAREIYTRFQIFVEGGFIRIIKAPKTIYPNFDKLSSTMNDNIKRVQWRAKQNIDFAYLCSYSKNISDYYLQLEDDVLSARNFSTYIRNQIYNVTRPWFMLEFSRLGFIGKLFKDEDLEWVAKYLMKNFEKAPGDLLLGKMLSVRGQRFPIHTHFSLFQHNGKFSSLENKMMPSIDSKFKDADSIKLPILSAPKGNNPPTKFKTSFQIVPGYFPSFAYDNNSTTFFWAKRPRKLDYLSLHFKSPHNFTRIIISTGDSKRKQDSLLNSALFTAIKHKSDVHIQGKCGSFILLADFIDGEIDTKAMGINIPNNIICLKIQLMKNSKTWIIIRDIVLI
ncbi:alpha-1,6-mannosyl-glycoprotein 4-beta-N-acetylglucosaminyltransferase-like isoform X2 [Mercenaria mercenaria]|uniref:alpha-1,6-mannosyl-glycoprotein 4-beta-N-acetylglucosaminyltransferase-like isoform X2 n=2 Tax=Mercenaria mercenaria TaxID=6596 RepID=UPI00234EE13A|nr:alpha-1,6-mannosyl-glycoprotein 4-beta-N-acetylglucosaminyltransferase-like isoform X2 [Mercenaria mercenaria]